MKWKQALPILMTALLINSAVRAAETPANALLILVKRDGILQIVDPNTLQVIARIPVGNDPHEVIASSDGKTAYVSNYGSGAITRSQLLIWSRRRHWRRSNLARCAVLMV